MSAREFEECKREEEKTLAKNLNIKYRGSPYSQYGTL